MSSQYFPPYENYNNNIEVQLDLTNYATNVKDDVKNITQIYKILVVTELKLI